MDKFPTSDTIADGKITVKVDVSHGTPKYWKEYSKYVHDEYHDELVAWERAYQAKIEEYEAKPWYKKIMSMPDTLSLEWHAPNNPELTLVGYYEWDTNIRHKNDSSNL